MNFLTKFENRNRYRYKQFFKYQEKDRFDGKGIEAVEFGGKTTWVMDNNKFILLVNDSGFPTMKLYISGSAKDSNHVISYEILIIWL